jgi:hypothetical protein
MRRMRSRHGTLAKARDPRPGIWDSEGVAVPEERQMVRGGLLLHYRPTAFWLPDYATDLEHLRAFPRYSRFRVRTLNTDEPLPRRVAELDFELVIVHYTVPAGGFYHLTEDHLRWLKTSRGHKVLINQDEDRYCGHRFWFINEVGFDAIETMLEPSEYGKVYGRHTRVPRIRTAIPGYVSQQMVADGERYATPDEQRPIDVGYRGRDVSPVMGRGGREKYVIGRSFKELGAKTALVLDIGLTLDDYLFGDDWSKFMARCKGMLGVESGVSVFDVDDRVMKQYEGLIEQGVEPTAENLTEAAAAEGRIYYRTISARHFEAAAMRCCQILFEGRYSGILEPMVHYIPLRKDFSNFDEVVRLFRDTALRRELTENAHRDLIASGRYSYERYMAEFDADLIEAGLEPDPSGPEVAVGDRAVNRGRRWRAARVQLRSIAPWSRFLSYTLGNLFRLSAYLRSRLGRPRRSTG